ncbi:ATP-dependent helicase HrpB [uncultured delta proteobacterium]|uniref:ATP-dependent helicase HrpB n=1 Tax=uncultured delta proteobacterium TaxID=34034 RepID=A0A212K3B9_9DELT|nr:ATP-dependent helicase HrpB [uncultured delta proteobacterium]
MQDSSSQGDFFPGAVPPASFPPASFPPASFPVDAAVPELVRALAGHGRAILRAILTASPGSGKTTRVPLALLGLLPGAAESGAAPLPGKILVLEPRRLAARAAARYMARLLNEEAGQRVGYRVRLESKVSAHTRVELLTEGMFTRRLLADPELSGVSCVIFDEFHERSLQADLGLALCLESAGAFRPDLRLLVMSATLETGELSRFLGDCPVIAAPGRAWPVTVRHAGRELAVTPSSGLEEVAGKTVLAVRDALRGERGSILAFLPGRAEIRRAAELLETRPGDTDVYPLYGDLPPREQDAAIAPPLPGRRKVVLATDLAQTSLTIEGVRIVIDAGLARGPRFEPGTGLSRLVTARVTQDAADQRAGRAGRLEPGLCLRLWPEKEALLPQARPEIADADLASLSLDALAWGSEPASLPWLTPPPEAALQHAAETLLALDAARPGPEGRLAITPHGQKLARLPLHPRLAHMVLQAEAVEPGLSCLAACLAALVSERDPLRKNAAGESDADIRLRLPLLRRPENKRLKDAAAQIHRLAGLNGVFTVPGPHEEDCCGMLLSLAWPERIAQRRGAGGFRLASGQGAELPGHDPLAAEPWLAVVSLGGGVNRRVHLAAPVSLADIARLHGAKARLEEDVAWDSRSEAVICRSVNRLGALVLEEKPLPPSPELRGRVTGALLEGIVSLGLESLPWTGELRQFQARVILLRTLERAEGGDANAWPDVSDAALLDGLQAGLRAWQADGRQDAPAAEPATGPEAAWLSPWLQGVSRRAQFSAIDLGAALRSLLPWPLPERLETEAPARLGLPSGSSAAVDYLPVLRGDPPVLAVKLQEMFGQTDTPRLGRGQIPVTLHLLSPAGRPLQVTDDLRHFWAHGYKQVRAEMRGRYPRHPWPEDPLSAAPTGKTKKRLEAASKR